MSFTPNANTQVLLHEGFEEDLTGWQTKNFSASKWDVLSGGFNSYKGDKCMYVTTDGSGAAADCWLISVPVKFEAGKKYSISFYYKCQVAMDNRLKYPLATILQRPPVLQYGKKHSTMIVI